MPRPGLLILVVLSAAPALAAPLPVPLPRLDPEGFPLPREAVRRLGSARFLTLSWDTRPVGYSADRRTLFTAGESVTAWDARTGRPLWTYAPAHTRFSTAALSPDGKMVWALAAKQPEGEHGAVEVVRLSAADGALVGRAVLRDSAWQNIPDLSPTGRLAIQRNNRRVDLVDGMTGQKVGSWTAPEQETVSAATIAPDGRRVAIGSTAQGPDGRQVGSLVRVVDPTSGRVEHELPVGQPVPYVGFDLRFGPNGRHLYALIRPNGWSGPIAPDGALQSWDLRTGTVRFNLKVTSDLGGGLMAAPQTLAVSPDGTTAAVSGWGRPVLVYDLPAGTVRFRLPVTPFATPAFDPTGKVLAVGGLVVTQWDAATGKRLPHSAAPYSIGGGLLFSPDGRRLAARPAWEVDQVDWDVRTGREVARAPWPKAVSDGLPGRTGNVDPYGRPVVVRSPDGAVVARLVLHREELGHPDNGKIVLTDATTGRELRTLPSAGNFTRSLTFSADGRFLTSDLDALVAVYDTAAGKLLHKLTSERDPTAGSVTPGCGRVCPSPDGRHAAVIEVNANTTGACRWSVGVYDLPTGREVKRFRGEGTLYALAWSADGTRLAAAGHLDGVINSKKGVLFLGDLGTARPPLPTIRTDAPADAVALSPDGKTLAVPAGDGRVQLWEVATGKVRHTFVGHRYSPLALAFSPDGRLLATSAVDGLLIWDVAGELARPAADAAALERAWDDLAADDPARAFRAVRLLAAVPDAALPLLKRKFAAEPPTPRADRVPALIKQLDAPVFADREKAEAELKQLADVAAAALRKASDEDPSPEVRERAARVLAAGPPRTPDRLRAGRAVEAVGWVGTPEAIGLLQHWSRGPAAPITAEAAAAVERLRKQTAGGR